MNAKRTGIAIFVATIAAASYATVAMAAVKNWNAGSGDWNVAGNWSPASVPTAGEPVRIAFTDGVARTVTYNVAAPSLGFLAIDLTGAGSTASTLSLPSSFNLRASAISVGGHNGSVETNGRGALVQSGGTTTISSGVDLIVGWGAGSTGAYTLSGGALVANQSEWIGISGTGTFNHSGGTNTVNANAVGSFFVGARAGSTGTYNLSGTGALTSYESEYVGDSGTGVFNQTGGTNTISGAGNHLYLGSSATGVGTQKD